MQVSSSQARESKATDRGSTVVESVAAALRGRILAGEFAPGSFLRDVRMAEEHETSRHTFRAAARLLVADGLLRQEAFRGFYVPEFGPDDIVDITRMRALLEGEAVRTITQFGEIPPDALSALEVMRRRPKDTAALVTADRDFHRAIVNAGRSERLSKGYVAIEVELELLLTQRQGFYHDPGQMYEEHRELIVGLKSRVADVALKAFQIHWSDLQSKLLSPRT